MSRDTDKNFFIVSSVPQFYQYLLKGVANFEELGNHVIKQIKAAHAFREVEQVRGLSSLLLSIPIKEYQLIGRYYLHWCGYRNHEYDIATLEIIIDHTQTYKAQALLSRGAFEYDNRRIHEALYFLAEALKTRPDVSEYIAISIAIAVAKAADGFHHLALADMERLLPIIKHAEPRLYFDFLNSYAVELGEAGRKDEARNISHIVLASPFIHAYPEWRETSQDLKEPDRSLVAVASIEPEPLEIEATELHHAGEPEQPSTVLAFPTLKEAPRPHKPDPLTPQELAELTDDDKKELILAALKSGAVRGDDYDKLMCMVGLLKSGPADKILDLENEAVLDDIAVIWPMQVGAEEFAGFLSALRDCDDILRLKDILDRIIRKVYHETQECGLSEEEWRLRVERRLPEK